jgi:hypothetical protein
VFGATPPTEYFGANASAHPYGNKGKQLRDIEGKHGAPLGETIMQNAAEGTIKETTYRPRPGTDKPLEKTSDFSPVARVELKADADNLRVDPIKNLVFAGFGSGGSA